MDDLPQSFEPIVENETDSPLPIQVQGERNENSNFRRDSDIFSIERDNRISRAYNGLFRNNIFESLHDNNINPNQEEVNRAGMFLSLRDRSIRESISLNRNPSETNINLSEALSNDEDMLLYNDFPYYHNIEDSSLVSPHNNFLRLSANDSVPGDYSLNLARERIVSDNSISNNNEERINTINSRNLNLFDDIFHNQPFTQLGRRRRLSASALWIRRRAARERTEAARDTPFLQGFRRHSTFRNPFVIDLDNSYANRDRGLDEELVEDHRTYYVHSKVRKNNYLELFTS